MCSKVKKKIKEKEIHAEISFYGNNIISLLVVDTQWREKCCQVVKKMQLGQMAGTACLL